MTMLKWLFVVLMLAGCCTIKPSPFVHSVAGFEYRTTVRIMNMCLEGPKFGTGVIISDKYILTANHVTVCKIGAPLTMIVANSQHENFSVALDRRDEENDIARLTPINNIRFPVWARISFSEPELGDPVCVVAGDEAVFMQRKCGEIGPRLGPFLQMNTATFPGNSGAAVWDNTGAIVGILVRGRWAQDDEHIGCAVPINTIRSQFLDDIYP